MDSTLPLTPRPNPTTAGSSRPRPIAEAPESMERAVELLRTSTALSELGGAEARCIVGYMKVVSYPAGATLLREGDQTDTGYMLLVLQGDVSVETVDASAADPVAVSVLGPGSLIGEMGLLDGAPRSMSCLAATRIEAAGLSREALELLIDEHPRVGAKLMTAISQRLADRLRAAGLQMRIYTQLVSEMQAQINALKRRG